jgi:hypothetical protein
VTEAVVGVRLQIAYHSSVPPRGGGVWRWGSFGPFASWVIAISLLCRFLPEQFFTAQACASAWFQQQSLGGQFSSGETLWSKDSGCNASGVCWHRMANIFNPSADTRPHNKHSFVRASPCRESLRGVTLPGRQRQGADTRPATSILFRASRCREEPPEGFSSRTAVPVPLYVRCHRQSPDLIHRLRPPNSLP